MSFHPLISVKSEKALKAILSTKLAAPINLLETTLLCEVTEAGSTETAVFGKVATEERSSNIESHGRISLSDDIHGALAFLGSIGEILNKTALGGLVHDLNDGCLLSNVGDNVAVVFADFLNFFSLRLVNIVQLSNVDLAFSDVMDELGLGVCVSLSNLSINLFVGISVDGSDGFFFNGLIFFEKLVKSSCNAAEETIKGMGTGTFVFLDVNAAFADGVSSAGLLIGNELFDHLGMTSSFGNKRQFGHSLELRDASETLLGGRPCFDSVVTNDQWLDKCDIKGQSAGKEAGSGKCFHFEALLIIY